MGISKKEAKKKNVVKSAISLLDKQLHQLEEQKIEFTEQGKQAKLKGLNDQYSAAVSMLRITAAMQKQVNSIKINFELALQTGDTFRIYSEFLDGMKSLGYEMLRLTDESGYKEVERLFSDAKANADAVFAKADTYIDEFQTQINKHSNDEN